MVIKPSSWVRKASDPLPFLGVENINLINPISEITKHFKPAGKSKES